ncbi:hypothetical protein SmJEL517_g02800 [Synchytrium microbalum]|uniref:Pre-mRNA-splicing factor 18 n=1 Tax=Synchytrium microbalum TaxID=1806994 RepID=A0A507C083_9FUNG|nr:uncharacterized protein SmJEL517_g02800 [Synchytrium microbalum]TPX34487.1 hypothetical protein SmJEL517_g02800 [Synchytrium microbalum]
MGDLLKREIERKRKEREETAQKLGVTDKKYIKRGDLERLRQDEYRQEQERKDQERLLKQGIQQQSLASKSAPGTSSNVPDNTDPNDAEYTLTEDEIIRRLRAIEQPIRLFAESDKERYKRLRTVESHLDERRGHEGQGNDWRKAMETTNKELTSALLSKGGTTDDDAARKRKKLDVDEDAVQVDTTSISLELYEREPDTCRRLVRMYLTRMLNEWESDLKGRGDEWKSSGQGRMQIATMNQSLEYMKPFFKGLKKREVPLDVEAKIAEICHWVQEREYQTANDVYLRMSIGNAPWPIGVTMVGIHERSGREKIFSSQIAHALNDETQRKWIQSIKRLMTWAQQKYPPADLSKLMG